MPDTRSRPFASSPFARTVLEERYAWHLKSPEARFLGLPNEDRHETWPEVAERVVDAVMSAVPPACDGKYTDFQGCARACFVSEGCGLVGCLSRQPTSFDLGAVRNTAGSARPPRLTPWSHSEHDALCFCVDCLGSEAV